MQKPKKSACKISTFFLIGISIVFCGNVFMTTIGNAQTITLSPDPLTILLNGSEDMTVTISNPASAGSVEIQLSTDDPSCVIIPPSVIILEGIDSANITVMALDIECTTSINASAIEYGDYSATVLVGLEPDSDGDSVVDNQDNCPNHPNGPALGTCTSGLEELIGVQHCTIPGINESECGTNGYCSMNQEDIYPPGGNGVGDACDCEGNFDCDGDVDGTDAAKFKEDFGRSSFKNPCPACQ